MKTRERVIAALHHEVPDRDPMQISFTPKFAADLKRELRFTESDLHNPHGGGNTYRVERDTPMENCWAMVEAIEGTPGF